MKVGSNVVRIMEGGQVRKWWDGGASVLVGARRAIGEMPNK